MNTTLEPPQKTSPFIRESIEKRLRELRDKCALEKEGLRHATEPGNWGTDFGTDTYWADTKKRCAIERAVSFQTVLDALASFIAEHRPIMGAEWIGNEHGRLCWAEYLGGCPIGVNYCQKEENHAGNCANEIGAWPKGVRGEQMWHELLKTLPKGATGLEETKS